MVNPITCLLAVYSLQHQILCQGMKEHMIGPAIARVSSAGFSVDTLIKVKSIMDLDELIVAPYFGYE